MKHDLYFPLLLRPISIELSLLVQLGMELEQHLKVITFLAAEVALQLLTAVLYQTIFQACLVGSQTNSKPIAEWLVEFAEFASSIEKQSIVHFSADLLVVNLKGISCLLLGVAPMLG